MIEITYEIGDRVSREVYMDDGTWDRLGDVCLANSPLKYGNVIGIGCDHASLVYKVRWDNGTIGRYFCWGITKE